LTLPVALLVLWIFHRFVTIPLIGLLPDSIQKRLDRGDEFCSGGGTRFVAIVASVLLGIATHVVWDSFTHPDTWRYDHWVPLRQALRLPIVGLVPVYKILQHGSTILGLGLLSIWVWRWFTRTKPSVLLPKKSLSPKQKVTTILVIVGLSFWGGIVRALWGNGIPSASVAFKRFVGQTVVTVIALAWWQIVVYGMLVANTAMGSSDPRLRP
jgi:hypothetical protein